MPSVTSSSFDLGRSELAVAERAAAMAASDGCWACADSRVPRPRVRINDARRNREPDFIGQLQTKRGLFTWGSRPTVTLNCLSPVPHFYQRMPTTCTLQPAEVLVH